MQEQLETLLTDKDIQRIIGHPSKIVTYPDLKNYKSIEQLFGNVDHVVLLFINEIEGNNISGHWCLLTRTKRNNNTIIEFLDPYGIDIDLQKKYYSKIWKDESGQTTNYLSRLLYKFMKESKNNKVEYNEFGLQKEKPDINTCGRHVGLRGFFYKIPLPKYQKIFKDMKKKGYNLDKIVTVLTNQLNGGKF